MSGFTFRPKLKDADYYMDAITDIIDGNMNEVKAPVIDFLLDEEKACELNNELSAANLLRRIRLHLIDL
jgi:hypothetical protein